MKSQMALVAKKHARTHEWLDQRSLALDRAIADMIRSQPEMLQRARATLDRWIEQRAPNVPQALLEWKGILDRCETEEILSLITREDEEARRLRQSSPFCGILPQEIRHKILLEYESC
jgi:hypothetical protein